MPVKPPAPPRDARARFDRADLTRRAGERPWGDGTYRRRIIVRRVDAHTVTGELEDDFHHFGVRVGHDDTAITWIEGATERHPWDVCAEADEPIQAVIGTTLRDDPAVLAELDARHNCTHLFDLAGLVVAHAARTTTERRFDAEITDPDHDGDRTARLWVDGDLVIEWALQQREVVGPERWAGIPLWKGFMGWALGELDPTTAEAAIVLRRAVDISRGRMQDLDDYRSNAELAGFMTGICHAFTPENNERGVRLTGSARDFTDLPELLLADFDDRNPA
ncbi:MAG: DUF2889 domain-containing protein [Actinomycetota bacterium]